MCTDVYLQGSSVGNEKITGSCLPADVKAVSLAFSPGGGGGVTPMGYIGTCRGIGYGF